MEQDETINMNLKVGKDFHNRLKEYRKKCGGINLRIIVEAAVNKFMASNKPKVF